MTCLHVFDMDGTLLVGSATLEISRSAGVFEQTVLIEQAWARGELSDNGFWKNCLPLWHGLTARQVDEAFANAPWLDGVQAVFRDIRARGEHSAVISQSPRFFVERLAQWGLESAFGALVTPGNAAGADQLVSREDKLNITRGLLADLALDEKRCVVYGDSSSDLTLFETLTRKVGINAQPHIRELATVNYDGRDLWSAYLAGRALMAGCPA